MCLAIVTTEHRHTRINQFVRQCLTGNKQAALNSGSSGAVHRVHCRLITYWPWALEKPLKGSLVSEEALQSVITKSDKILLLCLLIG